ncbi:hypothetical protein RUM44_006924 [Polyplax serrata]|uniref:Cyclic nucleotide-binding domain-containing protein n=1 Tax=Polyplax serrata TaxID=468196 RepID=A0ABR1B0W8_POLSC
MLSESDQRKSRSELQSLIRSVNRSKRLFKIKRTPKFVFRALVRTVINNLKWLMEEAIEEGKVTTKSQQLTTAIKGLLRVPVDQRSQEEKETLLKVLGSRVQSFERYPEKVRERLSTSAMFAYFPPGRVLVAEGHPSIAMYFILSGQANVSKMQYDPGEKKFKSVDMTVMNAGDAFGEINILHDEPWPTTVTTITHIEVLTVLQEHFKNILEEFLGEQQKEITRCLNRFAYFKDWNHRTVVECCILARIVRFEDNIIIMGGHTGDTENSYFLVTGSCQVIYHLQLQHIPRQGYTELKVLDWSVQEDQETFPLSDTVKNIPRPRRRKIADPFVSGLIVDKTLQQIISELPLPENETEEGEKIQVQSYFFQVATLSPGACFGIGECLENKFIISSSHPTILLRIPKFFLKLHNVGNIWGRIRGFFNNTYPSPQTIFNQFQIDRKWTKSRRKYLESLIKPERPFIGLTTAEAPYYSRLTNDFENPIFHRIKKVVLKKQQK